jgi:hypothetical protein
MELIRNALDKLGSFGVFARSLLPAGRLILVCAGFFALAVIVFFCQSLYRTRLLAAAASAGGKKRRLAGAVLSALVEALGKIITHFFVLLPMLGGIVAAVFLASGIMGAVSSVSEFVERERRIRELTVAIKYLDQSSKVIDVRVLSVTNGRSSLRLSYSAADPADPSVPPVSWKRDMEIQGTDIFFDCMVLNFTYSEVASGRQKNIAVPYRVFSNLVPAREGITLHETAFTIPPDDDFGDIPPVYRDRLRQLLEDEAFARDMGVRSVNGSAPHRRVKAGDRFSVRIEQSGGVRFE